MTAVWAIRLSSLLNVNEEPRSCACSTATAYSTVCPTIVLHITMCVASATTLIPIVHNSSSQGYEVWDLQIRVCIYDIVIRATSIVNSDFFSFLFCFYFTTFGRLQIAQHLFIFNYYVDVYVPYIILVCFKEYCFNKKAHLLEFTLRILSGYSLQIGIAKYASALSHTRHGHQTTAKVTLNQSDQSYERPSVDDQPWVQIEHTRRI